MVARGLVAVSLTVLSLMVAGCGKGKGGMASTTTAKTAGTAVASAKDKAKEKEKKEKEKKDPNAPPRPPVQHPDFPNTPDGAKALVSQFIAPNADQSVLARSLRPDLEDYDVVFTPDAGYAGQASFRITADDGFNSSPEVAVPVTVSSAPLVNIDFSLRRMLVGVGDVRVLRVIGDFADQQDVILPFEYVNARVLDPSVASLTPQGLLTALKDVEDALVALRGDRERLVRLQAAADAAGNAALLAQQRYSSGLIDFQSVLETQRTLLSTQDSLAATVASISADHVRLYKALGGGWR